MSCGLLSPYTPVRRLTQPAHASIFFPSGPTRVAYYHIRLTRPRIHLLPLPQVCEEQGEAPRHHDKALELFERMKQARKDLRTYMPAPRLPSFECHRLGRLVGRLACGRGVMSCTHTRARVPSLSLPAFFPSHD